MVLLVGILVYDGAEVLDFCGPFEVFRVTSSLVDEGVEVVTVGVSGEELNAQGLRIFPDYSFQSCPQLDILVIPGGRGRWLADQSHILDWMDKQFAGMRHLLTVCTGALAPAKRGYFPKGTRATTHQESIDYLRELAEGEVDGNARFTDNGKVLTSGGISAGIDSSLYLVGRLYGVDEAERVAKYMEYDWRFKEPDLPW